ncbi:MAG: glycosyltransferase [candidate division WOR-3 bacterium]
MKVLHVGYGFIPWRGGGLIEYAEDLMAEQVKKGYKVAYFCSGRHYPLYRKTFLKKWLKNGFTIYEVVNPPIYFGGDRGTVFDLDCYIIEKLFVKVIEEFQPNIIHIQELAGLPSSLIDIIANNKIPSLMTLQDYFLLCPKLKLFDYNQNDCFDKVIGRKCVFCVKDYYKNNKRTLIRNTLVYEVKKFPLLSGFLKQIYRFTKKFLQNVKSFVSHTYETNPLDLAIFFQKRRDLNINRLQKINLLIAQSLKVEEIYKFFLGESSRVITLHLTVKHIENIKPKLINPTIPVKFGTLNGMTSIPKGANILYKAVEILNNKGLKKKFELHIYGGLLPEIAESIKNYNNIFYHGGYEVKKLNELLDNIDVGIIPSIWQEAFGYVGIEFLAKGIPVIGNNKGGIVDYTIDGFTGWINKTSTSEELAEIMEQIIKKPDVIQEYNRKIIEKRNQIVKTMEQHFYEIDKIYKDVINKL